MYIASTFITTLVIKSDNEKPHLAHMGREYLGTPAASLIYLSRDIRARRRFCLWQIHETALEMAGGSKLVTCFTKELSRTSGLFNMKVMHMQTKEESIGEKTELNTNDGMRISTLLSDSCFYFSKEVLHKAIKRAMVM